MQLFTFRLRVNVFAVVFLPGILSGGIVELNGLMEMFFGALGRNKIKE